MNDSLTGGQYSLCRALLGLALAGGCAGVVLRAAALSQAGHQASGAVAVALAAGAAAIVFAAGALDRAAAALLIAAGLFLGWLGLFGAGAGGIAVAGTLLIHLAQPGAPYGSLAAIGRVDPGGGWRPRRGSAVAIWLLLAVAQGSAAFGGALADGLPEAFLGTFAEAWPLVVGLLAAAAAFVPRLRGAAFAALAATHLSALLRGGGSDDAAFLLVLPFAIDPGWFGSGRGARTATPDLVLYDGDCGLCHRAVRFLIAEDREGTRFRFAPLGGHEASRRLGAAAAPEDLPDSILLLPGGAAGPILVRSAAVLAALDRLGGLWRLIAIAGRLVPRSFGDALYDGVARVRRRIFAPPRAACPLVPPALRTRFTFDRPGESAGVEAAAGAAAPGGSGPTGSRRGGTASPGSPDGSPPPSA